MDCKNRITKWLKVLDKHHLWPSFSIALQIVWKKNTEEEIMKVVNAANVVANTMFYGVGTEKELVQNIVANGPCVLATMERYDEVVDFSINPSPLPVMD